MTIQLAMETTGRHGSIALVTSVRAGSVQVIDHAALPNDRRAAETLTPQIKHMLERNPGCRETLQFISVASGPGSFTGLRVGVTTAKTLAYAWQLPLICVGSLDAIAAETFRVRDRVDRLTVAIEAYRRQAYVARFDRNQYNAVAETDLAAKNTSQQAIAMSLEALTDSVKHLAEDHFVTGDAKLFADHAKFLGRTCDAVGVAVVASVLAQHQAWDDPMAAAPQYLKPSAAMEKSAATEKSAAVEKSAASG